MRKIILATSNQDKIAEFNHLFRDTDYEIIPQNLFQVSAIQETGLTFVENAILKARNACAHTGLPAIADDSGLVIDALNGEPGVRSARYAHENATYAENCQLVLQKMLTIPNEQRSAKFYCMLVYLRFTEDPTPLIVQGIWEGSILFKQHNGKGFGYDPIFFVPTHNCAASELPMNIKNKISHRGKALQQIMNYKL